MAGALQRGVWAVAGGHDVGVGMQLVGACEAARAAFEASLEAQATKMFDAPLAQPLELGAYALPPTLVRECDLTVGDAFGGDATVRMRIE